MSQGGIDVQRLLGLREPAYLLALRLTGSREGAEDIVQDAYLRALDRLRRGERPSDLRLWFLRLAANSARAMVRGEARRRRREENVARASTIQPAIDGATREALRAAMWQLDAEERTTLSLHYESGLTQAEVAQADQSFAQ